MKFEDNTGNDIDLNKFDLLIKFVNNIFDGKQVLIRLWWNGQKWNLW